VAGARKSKGKAETAAREQKTFLALRNAVNREEEELEQFLFANPLPLYLQEERMIVLSYHSLEDRPVKHAFQRFGARGRFFRVLTKKGDRSQ